MRPKAQWPFEADQGSLGRVHCGTGTRLTPRFAPAALSSEGKDHFYLVPWDDHNQIFDNIWCYLTIFGVLEVNNQIFDNIWHLGITTTKYLTIFGAI